MNLLKEPVNLLRKMVAPILDLVYPRNCQMCSRPLADIEAGVICGGCLATAKLIEPPFCDRCSAPFAGTNSGAFVCGYCQDLRFGFVRAVCACRAEGIVREAIHRFKYNREMYFGQHLAAWLLGAARERIDWSAVDAIVPVPLHPRKKRQREFNQAEYLAAALSRAMSVPIITKGLRRQKDTPTQTKLSAKARAENLRIAFGVRRPSCSPAHLVLVDDVFTTGATMDSCARVLLVAGAASVIALTVARGT